MNKLVTGVKRFLREEEGTEVVEWALVAGLIIVVGATLFLLMGGHVQDIFEALEGMLSSAAGNAEGG
jgi:pilus assembly protein Flp/PilA